MAKFEDTKDYTFSGFCRLHDEFIIPRFQRPYDWKNKQLLDFLDSVLEAEEKNYFIGNIVSIKTQGSESSISIVDGQQRLTTIFLILIALRKILASLNDDKKNKEKINELERKISYILDYKNLDTDEFMSKLRLHRDNCQKVFDAIKNGEDIDIKNLATDTERKYLKNYEILKKEIENKISRNGSDDILKNIAIFYEKTQSLQFVSIQCASDNDVNQIFEGFNSTGLGLSVADLVKNAVIQAAKADSDIQGKAESLWDYIESMFDKKTMARFPKFIRYQWMSRHGYISNSNLFKQIKSQKIEDEYKEDVLGYVQELVKDAEVYMGHIYAEYEKNLKLPKTLYEEIRKFRFLQTEQVYSVLMAYYRCFQEKKIKEGQYLGMLRKLWIFAFRTRFVSISPSDYERVFASHCDELANKCEDSSEVSKYSDIFFSKLSRQVSNSQEFISNFELEVNWKTDSQLIKTVLLELMSQEKAEVILKNPENEHILPRAPEKWGYEKDQVQEFVHKIGNMTLLFEADNKSASDEVFEVKEKIYKKSIFKQNKEISTKWGKYFKGDLSSINKGIELRGKELSKKIEQLLKFN